jgi:beta-glucosidase
MARESLVLLKNQNHFLPLKKSYATIAVIGPNADDEDALVGNYHGTPSQAVTIVEGIRRRFANSRVLYAQGTGLVGPVMKTVPASAFFTDASRTTPGLQAEYFSNPDLQGAPAMRRTDADVDFAWGTAGATPRLAKNFSVRWSGVLLAPATGNYQIGFTGQDGYRLWLNNSPLIQDWTRHHPASSRSKGIFLEKGRAYPIKIEFFAGFRGAVAQLRWNLPGENGQHALEAARQAELIIMALGLSPTIEGEEMDVNLPGFAGGDRTSIDLPAAQRKLLQQVQALGKPTLLVLLNGSALAVNWADRNLPAILEAWYPGEEGGTAVAEALAGDFSPGGRLPVTFYKSLAQVPPFADYSMAGRTYRYFRGTPLYPFGYGLSYTSFTYRNARLEPARVEAKGTVTVSAEVANTGGVAGDEVVQLYLTHPGVAGAPLRALEGFQRVHLQPGQKRTVSFSLANRQLSVVDAAGQRRILPGKVQVWIGGGQPVSRPGLARPAGVETSFTLTGSATLPQ